MHLWSSKVEKMTHVLEKLGTRKIRHARGSLFSHLTSVQKILESWGCDEDTQLAGLYHSIYSTEYFTKQVLTPDEREKLQKAIGLRAEHIVFCFSMLDRKRIEYSADTNTFRFYDYITNKPLECNSSDAVSLVHVMLANDIDHIDTIGIGSKLTWYKKYISFRNTFLPKPRFELEKIFREERPVSPHTNSPYVRFIGHSGVQIADADTSLVIDPWLYDSTPEKPIIEGLDPTQYSIDYLLPEPRNSARELSPDVVCLSHLHTHHSPLREIIDFASIKPITVVCPTLTPEKLEALKIKLGDFIFYRVQFIFIDSDTTVTVGKFQIQAMTHRDKPFVHLMFYVRLNSVSIMHIVDASTNNYKNRISGQLFSDNWNRVDGLKPDFLFIGAAGHHKKVIENGVRSIREANTFTPTQAAQLTVRIMPHYVGIIGLYNHSVWDDRYELALSTGEAESQFYWSLSFLAPAIRMKKLLPGDTFFK